MKVLLVTLDRLEHIAFTSGIPAYVDATRGVAFLRRGQVRYEAPLREAS